MRPQNFVYLFLSCFHIPTACEEYDNYYDDAEVEEISEGAGVAEVSEVSEVGEVSEGAGVALAETTVSYESAQPTDSTHIKIPYERWKISFNMLQKKPQTSTGTILRLNSGRLSVSIISIINEILCLLI